MIPGAEDPASADNARRRWIEAALIVAFWVCIFMLTAGRRAIGPWGPGGPGGLSTNEVLQAGITYAVWLLLTPGIFWLAVRFSLDRRDWPLSLLLHLGAALVVAVAMEVLWYHTFRALVWEPGSFGFRSADRSFSMARTVFSLRFLDELIIYFVVLAAGFARDYFHRYRQRQEEASQLRAQSAELQAQLAEARLQALRMQINPHFLFNTLHAISSLVERDAVGVQRMVARLSKLLRYALESSSSQEVPLEEELAFLDDYLEIQRIRFEEHLDVSLDVAPRVEEGLVPSLILQPLVENAIKHGASKAEGKGFVEITARREGNDLVMRVRDNGPGLGSTTDNGQQPRTEGIGLANTRERLENLYGDAQSLTFHAVEDGGLVVQIVVPYHTRADLYTPAYSSEE